MSIKLSAEQADAIRRGQGRVEAEDDAGEPYVIIHKDVYTHLKVLSAEADQQSRQRLRDLIQAGIESGDYQPHDQVFAELRQYAANLDSQRES